MANKTEEKITQKAVLEFLEAKRIFHWRNNSGAVITSYKGKERMFCFGAKGSPDIFALKDGMLYGFEIKGTDPKKSKQNENQILFGEQMNKHGGKYFVIRSIDEVLALFS